MNPKLVEIVCQKCNKLQPWRGQANCLHCDQRLNNWSVASQLSLKETANARRTDSVEPLDAA